ncbi:YtxH domain-containing protein [Paenibacillus sabinae]|uniref:Gas vesicle protein n=1 Tax=Paenibacillus sabinae T27 TaxID=1268072 RepID=X4ZYV6_9BACL|nr:YtxH domain-containing protein [Paenibacillus sabinae]AHV96844.1 gas vesicle protein [Paenibacillus sabinae T27]
MKKNTKSLLWGIVAGGAVGSVTALLLAPKAGKELRKDISDGATATIDKAQELVQQAADKGAEWYGKAKDSVDLVIQEVADWSKQFVGEDEPEAVTVSSIADTGATAKSAEASFEDEAAVSSADLAGNEAGKQA